MKLSPLSLTRKLISHNTINPPGNESVCADFISSILESHGLEVDQIHLSENRSCLWAISARESESSYLYFCGHMDTVPLGKQQWSVGPFSGEVKEGRVYGRGASDMKSGLAAMIFSALRVSRVKGQKRGVVFLFTCGEETFCEGVRHLASIKDRLPPMGALVVCEPTSNHVCVAHKGAIHYLLTFHGKSAHASMPHLGSNAIYKACKGIQTIQTLKLVRSPHPLLGYPTLSVGTINGGENINSVPDSVSIGLDIRVLPGQKEPDIRASLKEALGPEVEIDLLNQAPGIYTSPDDPWVGQVMEIVEGITGKKSEPQTVPYFTDASILTPAFGNPPTVILGPGQPEMAHKTDEYCYISKLEEAIEIYWKLIEKWCIQ